MGRKTLKYNFVLFVVFFLFAAVLFSQGYLVHHYSETDRFPSSNVYDITQDSLGRMWFATRGGITFYDGVSWKTYTVSDDLRAHSFTKISVDRKGRIWALAEPVQHGNISVFFFDGPPGTTWNQIEDLNVHFTRQGEITSFQLVEQKGEDKPTLAMGSANSGLFRWKQGKWVRLTTKDGLLSNSVSGIAVFKGKCYVATDNGVSVLKNDGTIDNQLNRLLGLPSKKIKGTCVEYKDKYPGARLKHCRLWLYGHQWLGYLDLEKSNDKIVLYDTGISIINKKPVIKLLPDYRGGLYFGNYKELYYFNYKTGTSAPIHAQNGLISEGANSMYIDFEKSIWIACQRGVSKISSRRFGNLQMIHGLLEDEVTAVVEVEPGKFVLGHNKGLTFWDGNKFLEMPFIDKDRTMASYCRVLDMKTDSKQNIWVAAEEVGLAKIINKGK